MDEEIIRNFGGDNWIDDQQMTLIMNLFSDEVRRRKYIISDYPQSFAIDPQFFSMLLCGTVEEVVNATAHFPLFEYQNILIPAIVDDNHWILIHVDFANVEINSYDSQLFEDGNVVEHLEELVLVEKFLKKFSRQTGRGRLRNFRKNAILCAEQENGDDCGVFVIVNAAKIMFSETPTFVQEDMPAVRMQIQQMIRAGMYLGFFK